MCKKIVLSSLIIFFASMNIFAEVAYIDPIQAYKTNYIITGEHIEDQVKFQLSIMYPLFWPFNTGLYFGYTQLSYWRIYDKSSPFEDTNYSPEFFYKFESGDNIFNDYRIKFVDYIQISPIQHRSNGQPSGPDDRSENKYYGEIQLSVGEVYNFGVRGKVFGYYNVADGNKDINVYHKNYETGIFFKNLSKRISGLEREKVEITFGGNPTNRGWVKAEVSARLITSYFQPRLFVQFFRGYDEFMMYYNIKTEAVRIGLSF